MDDNNVVAGETTNRDILAELRKLRQLKEDKAMINVYQLVAEGFFESKKRKTFEFSNKVWPTKKSAKKNVEWFRIRMAEYPEFPDGLFRVDPKTVKVRVVKLEIQDEKTIFTTR